MPNNNNEINASLHSIHSSRYYIMSFVIFILTTNYYTVP